MTATRASEPAESAASHRPDSSPDPSPDSPTDLDRRSWKYVARKTLREFGDDQCTDLAAALTYYAVLALFPAVIALTSVLGLVGQGTSAVQDVLDVVSGVGGSSVTDSVRGPLLQVSQAPGAGLAFVFGLLGALWSASGYVGAFGRAMNRMYEIREGRPVWKLRPANLLLTVVLVVLLAVMLLGLVVTGPVASSVGDVIGAGSTAVTVWDIAKWPVMLAVIVLIVALLYWGTPNVRQPKLRWVTPGALVAIVVWALASAAFGFYVANFSSYNKTYGSLAAVIVFLLWLWLTNLALLFGAELDAELERGRELQAGEPAESELQLPARDSRGIEKAEEKEREDEEKGREIRTRAGGSSS